MTATVSRILPIAAAMLLVLGQFFQAVAAEWVLIESEPDHSDFFYDKAGVARSPEGIVTVSGKVVYTPDGKKETLELLKNDQRYADLSYTLYTYQVNCDVRQHRLIGVTHVDGKGTKIVEFDLTGKTTWEKIASGSRIEDVVDLECQPGKE